MSTHKGIDLYGSGKFWVSCEWATGQVDVRDGVVVAVPAIWQKFRGQRMEELVGWLGNLEGGVTVERMNG